MKTSIIPICLIVPNNFSHKAGDGTSTRKHRTSNIHPALQANCGASQATYLLEWWEVNDFCRINTTKRSRLQTT